MNMSCICACLCNKHHIHLNMVLRSYIQDGSVLCINEAHSLFMVIPTYSISKHVTVRVGASSHKVQHTQRQWEANVGVQNSALEIVTNVRRHKATDDLKRTKYGHRRRSIWLADTKHHHLLNLKAVYCTCMFNADTQWHTWFKTMFSVCGRVSRVTISTDNDLSG